MGEWEAFCPETGVETVSRQDGFFIAARTRLSAVTHPAPPLPASDLPDDSRDSIGLKDDADPDALVVERTFCCVEELVLKRLFTCKRFDAPRFIQLMDHIARLDTVQHIFT